jgi:DNA repair protein RecO (recombination protein O)
VISGQSLLSLARHELSDATSLRDSKRLMRAILREYLGDKPLQSRMLYTQSRPQSTNE